MAHSRTRPGNIQDEPGVSIVPESKEVPTNNLTPQNKYPLHNDGGMSKEHGS